MKEKILEKISEELFLILLRLKSVKICSINTLLLLNESLKIVKLIETSVHEEKSEKFSIIENSNDKRDEFFDEVLCIYNRLLWIKCNYDNAGY